MRKKIFTITTVLVLSGFATGALAQTVEDANVSLSNLSSNSYFDSYDDNTKTVNGLNFLTLADGSNSSYVTPAFSIKVYIWDGSNPTFVKTFNCPGIYHFGSQTYSNETVDLSGLSLPAGTYQLGIYVDADDDIPNPPDDPNDNAYLLPGDINYTPSTSSINETEKIDLSVFPNPVSDAVNVSWGSNSDVNYQEIILKNLQGQVVKRMDVQPGQTSCKVDISDVAKGTYVLFLRSDKGMVSRQVVKN